MTLKEGFFGLGDLKIKWKPNPSDGGSLEQLEDSGFRVVVIWFVRYRRFRHSIPTLKTMAEYSTIPEILKNEK